MASQWWKSETGVGLTSWRGKLRSGLLSMYAGPLALWQEPLFTCPTATDEASDSEPLSASVCDFERYCRRVPPSEACWPKDYYHSKGWQADMTVAAGINEIGQLKFSASASNSTLYLLANPTEWKLHRQTSPELCQRLKEAAKRKFGNLGDQAAYLVTEVIRAERYIVCTSKAAGAEVTIDMMALAAAAAAGVQAATKFVVNVKDTEVQTFAPNCVVAYSMQAITWPLDKSDKDGLPQICQAGYHEAKRSKRSWVNDIARF